MLRCDKNGGEYRLRDSPSLSFRDEKGRIMEDRLYKKLETYGKSGFYPFHMPGLRGIRWLWRGDFPVERDITEIDGLDNPHHAEDILKRAQEDVARLYGVPESFTALMEALGDPGGGALRLWIRWGQILVARNCHKAVYYYADLSCGA